MFPSRTRTYPVFNQWHPWQMKKNKELRAFQPVAMMIRCHGLKIAQSLVNKGMPRCHGLTPPPEDQGAFEERAAILEFDGGMPRGKAEDRAREMLDHDDKDLD